MHKPNALEIVTGIFLVVGTLIIMAVLAYGASTTTVSAGERIADASVQIYVEQGDQLFGTCSGSVVNTNVGRAVLTAGHCIAGDGYDMIDEFGHKTRMTPIYVDHVHDVALLRIIGKSEGEIGAYDLSCSAKLTVGEHIRMTGYPLDLGRLSVEGQIISAEHTIGPWAVAAIAAMPAGEGNSGSAVRDDSGKVVGVLTGGMGSYGIVAVVVPVSVLCNPGIAG